MENHTSKLYDLQIINGMKGEAGQQLNAKFSFPVRTAGEVHSLLEYALHGMQNNPAVRRTSEYLSFQKPAPYWINSTKCLT